MNKQEILQSLYNVTQEERVFTVENMRTHKIHEMFDHKNQIGSFFKWINGAGYTKAMGVGKATHKAANKRWIWRWKWTDKAHKELVTDD